MNRTFRFWADKFKVIEQLVLDEVEKVLPEDAKPLFAEQIGLVNKIQRLSDGKEVNLYVKRGLMVVPAPPSLKFPLAVTEYRLASVGLSPKKPKAHDSSRRLGCKRSYLFD